MASKAKGIGEGILSTITNYIFWFLTGNLYFIILNIPLLILLSLLMAIGDRRFPPGFALIVFVCCIPIGPAITALFSVMGKVFREKDVNMTRDFFKAYRSNFVQAILLWVFGLLVIFLFYFDIRYLMSRNYPFALICVFYVLIAYVGFMSLFAFPIISRFHMKSLDVIKLSAYLVARHLHIAVFNVASFVMLGFLAFKLSTALLFLGPTILCFLIILNERKIFDQLEEKMDEGI